MLSLEEAREGVLLVVLLLSWRRKLKLENLVRELCVREVGRTGRGACSTGVAPLEGRKQLNGMVVERCSVWLYGRGVDRRW